MTRLTAKYKFSEPNERALFSSKLTKEISYLVTWFTSMLPNTEDIRSVESPFDFEVLSLMNNIIKADDVDFMGVELGALVKKCPMTSDMLFALLSLRGDISRSEFKEVTENSCYLLID
jgi:hypothetical protein